MGLPLLLRVLFENKVFIDDIQYFIYFYIPKYYLRKGQLTAQPEHAPAAASVLSY